MSQNQGNGSPRAASEQAPREETACASVPRRSGRARRLVTASDVVHDEGPCEEISARKAVVDVTASPATKIILTRNRVVSSLYGETRSVTVDDSSTVISAQTRATEAPRRNPRRKAAAENFEIPHNLLEQALSPMGFDEHREWQSWIEVESDPAFFNVIINKLGIRDVKVQELFTLDSLIELPKPVHGLVFLYQYVPEDIAEETESSDHVWFANQTTPNACATVALLNIIMNAAGIELGRNLEAFRNETAELDPPLRGNMLTNNIAIRTAHNSFARRLDLLNADLAMDNDVQDTKKTKAASSSAKARSKAKKSAQTLQASTEASFHFIAYVPIGTKIWQLDGLQKYPVCLGDIKGDWTSSIGPFIESRMLQYETEQVSFNLLAVCRNPLGSTRGQLAEKIRCHDILRSIGSGDGKPLGSWLTEGSSTREEKLAAYGLSELDVEAAAGQEVEDMLSKRDNGIFSRVERAHVNQQLEEEQKDILSLYAAQQTSIEDDSGVATGRMKDYTLLIHKWVTKLGEHGILQELQEQIGPQRSHT